MSATRVLCFFTAAGPLKEIISQSQWCSEEITKCFPFTPLSLHGIIHTQACWLVKDSAIKGAGDQGGNKVSMYLKTRNGWVVFYSYIITSASQGIILGPLYFLSWSYSQIKVATLVWCHPFGVTRNLPRDLGSCLSVWHELFTSYIPPTYKYPSQHVLQAKGHLLGRLSTILVIHVIRIRPINATRLSVTA